MTHEREKRSSAFVLYGLSKDTDVLATVRVGLWGPLAEVGVKIYSAFDSG
jgi:hypothetical protein